MNQNKFKLEALKREVHGRKVKKLRHQGLIPANVFGRGIKSQSISLNQKDFVSVYKQAGETSLIYLEIEGEKCPQPTLVANIEIHPLTQDLLHVDFHQVNLKEKVSASIPVEIVNEAPAVKEGHTLTLLMDEVEVQALPTDLPDEIVVDVSGLVQAGDMVTVKQLSLDRSIVEIMVDEDEPVVIIQEATQESDESEPETEEVDESKSETEE